MSHDLQIVSDNAARSSAGALPLPRVAIHIRPGTMDDLPFLDSLQKLHTKQVGWMPTKQFEGKIKLGHVLIAQDQSAKRVGYCIGHDQYFKRDDCGIIYQLNVVPDRRRSLIGATLIKAMFDRAAYGCKLFCCWCAQDIEANYFWESIGFVPLAFRAGSRGKGRVHIFWQRRIREGDSTTPYWFPSQTTSGSIREDRLVFPIPPGVHWRDAMPIILPSEETPKLECRDPKPIANRKLQVANKKPPAALGRLQFAAPVAPKGEKAKREARKKVKNDPKLVAAARELRDRWLEHVNTTPLLAPAISPLFSTAKYDVGRALAAAPVKVQVNPTLPKQLPEAA